MYPLRTEYEIGSAFKINWNEHKSAGTRVLSWKNWLAHDCATSSGAHCFCLVLHVSPNRTRALNTQAHKHACIRSVPARARSAVQLRSGPWAGRRDCHSSTSLQADRRVAQEHRPSHQRRSLPLGRHKHTPAKSGGWQEGMVAVGQIDLGSGTRLNRRFQKAWKQRVSQVPRFININTRR